ncbi:tetratricopeptide repeat protein [Streptomyces sp. NPDC056503]|uniref:tetratricopeptide repeat protein n=1 Tax=Streptomyces sp. NPDC056503 TaxID=3345842 RepID=UPI0036781354
MIGRRKELRQGDQWVVDSVVNGPVFQVSGVTGDVNLTVHQARPLYWLDGFPFDRPALSFTSARNQPGKLLKARYEVVDFTGRHSELAHLAAWRDGEEPVAALLLHGVGGQGKSRLAAEFARGSAERGWRVLQARHASLPDGGHPRGVGGSGGAGTLLVVDYADRWPAADLLALCADATRQPDRARVLLISRAAGAWWQMLAANDLDRLEIESDRLELGPLGDGRPGEPTSPRALFEAARDRFAEVLRIPGVEDLPPPRSLGEHEGFREALAVHMAALALVDAVHRHRQDGTALPALASPAEVSAYLLSRERAYWRDLHGHGRVRTAETELGQCVYVAALIGSQTYEDGLTAVTRAIDPVTGQSADRLLRDHAVAYPEGEEGGGGTFLEPLYPDRLAEDFLALSVSGHDIAFEDEPRSTEMAARLLGDGDGDGDTEAGRVWTRTALTVLSAAAARWPHLVTRQVAPLIAARPDLAIRAGGAALAALADLPGLPRDVLEAVDAELPFGRNADLDAGAAVVAYRLAHHWLADTQDPVAHALVRFNLVRRLVNAGLKAEALVTAQDSMPAWRYLADADPDTYEPGLASALTNLGMLLSAAGRHEEALDAARESVEILRRPAASDPDLVESLLPAALISLGGCLSGAGREAEALAPALEAVALFRPLAESDPGAHTVGLASALDGLAVALAQAGRYREALGPARECEEINRRLAGTDPAAYASDHASAAARLSGILVRVGRREEAVTPAQQAVDTYRPLAETNPAAYASDLGVALSDLGRSLWAAGRREEALDLARESVELARRLFEADPDTHAPALAQELSTLGSLLSRTGRRREAVAPLEEAVALGRQLAERDPDAHASGLADALGNLGELLWWVGRPQDALARTQGAVEVFRWLVTQRPARYRPALANALNSLAISLERADLPRAAVDTAQEAADLFRELAEADPDAHRPGLAMALKNLAEFLPKVGRFEKALDLAQESVAIRRELFEENPAAHGPGYAMALSVLASLLTEMGHPEEALHPARLGIAVRRTLAEAEPAAHAPGYGRAFGTLAGHLLNAGRWEEARAAVGEALRIHQPLAEADPAAHGSDLALTLGMLVSVEISSGRPGSPAAVDAAQEAVEILRRLARSRPEQYGGQLKNALAMLRYTQDGHF